MRIGQDSMAIPLTPLQTSAARDALAKSVYGRVFEWLGERINRTLTAGVQAAETDSDGNGVLIRSIGVLDIFGFEARVPAPHGGTHAALGGVPLHNYTHSHSLVGTNSLEQFLINYANERLQQHFIQQVLRDQQLEYAAEGLVVPHVAFADNRPCLELLQGTIALLEDEDSLEGVRSVSSAVAPAAGAGGEEESDRGGAVAASGEEQFLERLIHSYCPTLHPPRRTASPGNVPLSPSSTPRSPDPTASTSTTTVTPEPTLRRSVTTPVVSVGGVSVVTSAVVRATPRACTVPPTFAIGSAATAAGGGVLPSPSSCFERVLVRPSSFLIKHYAGDVEYSVRGFLFKNRDKLHDSLATVLSASEDELLSSLFAPATMPPPVVDALPPFSPLPPSPFHALSSPLEQTRLKEAGKQARQAKRAQVRASFRSVSFVHILFICTYTFHLYIYE